MIHRRTSRRGNRDTPEDVLLQVSLTLVVFLGFLLSLQAATQRDLDKRVDAVEKGAPFEHALEDTPGAASRAVRVAEREREMMQLLREWERLKQRWPLFRLVGRFDVSEGGGGVGLMRALDGNGLLALDDFDRFQKEVARLLIESDRPAPRPTAVDLEVDACVDACLRSAGLRRPPLDASTGGAAGATARRLARFDVAEALGRTARGEADPQNVQELQTRVRQEFGEQRAKVVAIQEHVIVKVARERMTAKVRQFIKDNPGADVSDGTWTARVYSAVLRDVATDVRWLEEVRRRFEELGR